MTLRSALTIATMIITTATTAHAAPVNSVKRINILQNQTSSPFFTLNSTADINLNPFSLTDANTNITFTPVGTVQAGQVTSLSSNGSFSVAGTSTSAGNWTDGNGVPAGITLTFNTQFTMAVGAGSPAGSYLTNPGATGSGLGNGVGITQTLGGNHTLDSGNLTSPPNPANESLEVSAMTVSNVSFAGTLAEPGFTFAPGSVGNFGPYVLRSNGFNETGETMGLKSATEIPDPANPNKATIGFGNPSADPSEIGRGEGTVASHVFIDDNFTNGAPTTPNFFPRQIGAFTLTPQNGTIAIKGIGYEYDVTFDISPIGVSVDADFDVDGDVDGNDFLIWQRNFGTASGATLAQGDADGNGAVNELDLAAWKTSFGGAATPVATVVPEPAAATLAAAFLLVTFARKRTR